MKMRWQAGLFLAVAAHSAFAAELVVANQYRHSLQFFNPANRAMTAEVVLEVAPHEVALSPDGKLAYAPIYGDAASVGLPGTDGHSIAVVDVRQHKLVDTIDLGKQIRPHRALFGADGLLYVTTELANSISVIDPKTRRVVGEVPTGEPQTHMFTLSRDGSRAYSTSVSLGIISVMDTQKRSLITTIPVSSRIQRVTVSQDGNRVYTNDQAKPQVVVIDAKTNRIAQTWPTTMLPFHAQETKDGHWLVVVEGEHLDGLVEAIDVKSGKVVRSAKLPGRPSSMLEHDGVLYLTLLYTGQIMELDLKTWQAKEFAGGDKGVDGIAWIP